MRVGQARKRDWNERAIRSALEAIGVRCFPISSPGLGDLLVWARQTGWCVIEVKAPRGKLTAAQKQLHALVPVHVVRTEAEALQIFGVTA
jgi:hypothetical protein